MGAPGPLLAGQYLTTTCILPPTSIWSGVKRENRIFLREGFPRVKITWYGFQNLSPYALSCREGSCTAPHKKAVFKARSFKLGIFSDQLSRSKSALLQGSCVVWGWDRMTPTAIKSTHLPYSTSTSREHTRQLSGANSTARRELELSRPSTIQSRTKNRNPMSFPGLVVVQYRG